MGNKLRELLDHNSETNRRLRRTLNRLKHQGMNKKECLYCANATIEYYRDGCEARCAFNLTEGSCGRWERRMKGEHDADSN